MTVAEAVNEISGMGVGWLFFIVFGMILEPAAGWAIVLLFLIVALS